ncbi:MAG TPA: hypothetical protein VII61_00640 [Ktedonobacteraceae bacterium]|jgi:adenylate kinase family enzyme
MKIHVIGAPGSGKTTLAHDIASRFHVPHYELDKVNWEQESVATIIERPAWITEGFYLVWTEPMLYHADCIVFLEVSWPIAAWRLISRHILNSLRNTQSYPGLNGIKALVILLKDTRRYTLNLGQTDKSTVEDLHKYLETRRGLAVPSKEEYQKTYPETYQKLALPPTEEFVRMYLEKYKGKLFLVKNATDRERLFELLEK